MISVLTHRSNQESTMTLDDRINVMEPGVIFVEVSLAVWLATKCVLLPLQWNRYERQNFGHCATGGLRSWCSTKEGFHFQA